MFFVKTQLLKVTKITLSIPLLILLLISPLIIQAVPIGGTFLYLTLLFFVFLFFIINFKQFMIGLIKPSLPMFIFFLYLFSFFIGICITGLETSIFELKEFIWGCFLFLILCCANIYFNTLTTLKRVEKIFTNSAVILVGAISVFAYLKYLTWRDGRVIRFLLNDLNLEYYPKGSALVGDINFFGLTMLICAFLSFSLWRRSSVLYSNIVWMLIFFLLMIVGCLAGSRRFLILSITLIPILFLLTIKLDANLIFKKAISILIAFSMIFGANYLINNISNISDYFELLYFIHFSDNDTFSENYIWNFYSSTYATLADQSQTYGYGSRITRWLYSLNLLDLKTVLIGDGFNYLSKYSCNFADCQSVDHPHAPIISSVLYGGVLGLLSYLILVSFLMFICIKLLLFSKLYFEWGLVLLCTIIYTSVSGNSLFSMPILFSVAIISYAAYKVEFGESDYAIAKRFFDVAASSLALVLLLPLLILIAMIILFLAGRPIFFCQSRPGLNCEIFKMYKFRTMYNLADENRQPLPDKDRLIPLGSFLRSSSLDELPELWNVLVGDMSLVGPRPLLEEYLPLYSSYQSRRHGVRPGITGWAQINGRNSLKWKEKFNLDIWYVENMSFWLDVKILGKTLIKVIQREGISTEGEASAKPFRGNN